MSYAAFGAPISACSPGQVPSAWGPCVPAGSYTGPPRQEQTPSTTQTPGTRYQRYDDEGNAYDDGSEYEDTSSDSGGGSGGSSRGGGYPGYPDMDAGDGGESTITTGVQWFLVAGAILGVGWLALDAARSR